MANIINQIIEIDAIAQKRLNEASKVREQYLNELKEKTAETNALLEKKTLARINRMYETEKQFADEQKATIEVQSEQTIKRLQETYQKKHAQLEQDIFNNVIAI